ncbi:MAG: hypothetical protein K2X87_07800 [Gemmataceae bacterium]|nr:hypothetical protein [Gemmataceae bacterium]
MPIAFECGCGKSFRAADGLAGKRTKCPACGAALTVPAPQAAEEDEAFRLLAEAPDVAPDPTRWNAPAAPPPPTPVPSPPPGPRPVRAPKGLKAVKSAREGRPLRITLSPAVWGGVFGVAGGGLWFALSLGGAGVPDFRAAAAVVLGLIAIGKGFLGHPED